MLWNGLATKQKSIHSNWSGLTKRWPLLSDTSSNHKIVRQRETWARDAAQAFAKGMPRDLRCTQIVGLHEAHIAGKMALRMLPARLRE